MGKQKKKGRNSGSGTSSMPNRETFERMNFLYQASQFYASMQPSSSSKNSNQDTASLLPLARVYNRDLRLVARKSVLRMTPHIKREICKVCATPLIPGVSSKVRVKGKENKQKYVSTNCAYCGWHKKLPVDSKYTLFVDKPEHATIH